MAGQRKPGEGVAGIARPDDDDPDPPHLTRCTSLRRPAAAWPQDVRDVRRRAAGARRGATGASLGGGQVP